MTKNRGGLLRLHRLSFFSDLIPCLMDHEGGLDILAELLEGSMYLGSVKMKRRRAMLVVEIGGKSGEIPGT